MDYVEVIFLGTIHNQHLSHGEYHFGHLKAAFIQAHAELLMVEVRPEQFRNGDLADGPLEMTYLSQLARAEGILVAGIDWYFDNHSEPMIEKELLQRISAELQQQEQPPGHGWPLSYQQCHKMAHLRYLQALHHIRVRHLGDNGHGDWLRRNSALILCGSFFFLHTNLCTLPKK